MRFGRKGSSYRLSLIACSALLSAATAVASADELSHQQKNDKSAAKDANVAAAQKLNGDSPDAKAKSGSDANKVNSDGTKNDSDTQKSDKLGGASGQTDTKNKKDAKKTANVVNQVPGVKVDQKDLEPPTAAPIKGFHPIKKLLRPVENLEGLSIKLEQQVMKLEGPIAALQPPMLSLQKKMTGVDEQLGTMQSQLTATQEEVKGVRADLAVMRKDIEQLKKPIVDLKKPIGTVAEPLAGLQRQLNFIMLAILVASISIAVGTPIAAVLMYKNRHKLFPDMKEHDMPKVEVPPSKPVSTR